LSTDRSFPKLVRYSYVSRSSLELGRWGEWIALKHLRKLGWDIVARNWKGFGGEVDLIAYDGPFLVFVEVKTRRNPVTRAPEDRVGWEKERKLDELAFNFLLRYEISETPVRIDVIAIETTDTKEFVLRHYRG
jgi:putative endonuclease